MDAPILRAEYEEHKKRMEDEHHRINRRIALLEETTKQIGQIAASTEKMAINMENMLEEQREQGKKLDSQGDRIAAMEKGPGDTWQRIKYKALDTGVGLIFGAFATGAVMLAAQYIK